MAKGPNLEDYLKQGIYGPKEIKPDEKRKFLGTFRERVIIALFVEQLYENGIYKEVEEEMKNSRGAKLLLNGAVPYRFLSKYVKLANTHGLPFTIVEKKDAETDIGLVLAYDHAINKEDIFINRETTKEAKSEQKKEPGLKGFLKKLFF